jgi:type III secretion protein V
VIVIERVQSEIDRIRSEVQSGNLLDVLTRFSDLLLVSCIAAMIGMMIVPLPTWLLDLLLTVNITAAVTILMVSIYISNATQIASYPTLLLITTLYRLALDISATRLILLQANAGEVIRSFGMFVVGGNFVVGAVIFLIITLVQFIVITKGAERVAEVSARFTLDAMPGKQMSIDADMRSGVINSNEARRRREALSRESAFYGAMDGAMKFVKGDAIAGIVITLINIIGGLVIGVAMRDMELMRAVQTYSILTIGNGLVSQIPALLISISAGMVVTRVASERENSNLGKDVATQILAQPKAIAVAAGILFVMALIPGLPKIPFFFLATLTGGTAFGLLKTIRINAGKTAAAAATEAVAEPDLTVTIPLVLELSKDLTPFVNTRTSEGRTFAQQFSEVRNALYYQTGVIFPPVQVRGDQPHAAGVYKIWMNEAPAATGQLRTDAALVNNSVANISIFGITGEDTKNPADGSPAAWISKSDIPRARTAGLQVWETHEILLMHLAQFLRKHARDFIGLQEVQWMVGRVKTFYPALADEIVPKSVTLQQLTEILQRLAEEGVPIRDLKSILQALSEAGRTDQDSASRAEQVRVAIRQRLCFHLSGGSPTLFIYQLDPEVEELFRNSVRQGAGGPQLAMDPESVQRVFAAADARLANLPVTAQKPVILTDSDIRRFVYRLLSFHLPEISVISYDQLTPRISVQPLGVIAFLETETPGEELRLESSVG